MSASVVGYELDGGIATLRLDDGKANALSVETLRALHEGLDRAEGDGAVVLLAGREGRFSAGFDLGVFAAGGPPVLEMLRLGATFAARLLAFPAPVVIACTGHAVAAGTFPLLAADVRIGADGPFRLGLNEVQIGLTVPWFAIELARHRLAPAAFDAAVVGATMHTPESAVTAGFLDAVVPPSEVLGVAREHAERVAALNRDAHAATKLRARGRVIEAVEAAIESEFPADRTA
jgi:enoyl-CoA hydratase